MAEDVETLIKRAQHAAGEMERLSMIAAQLAKDTRKMLGNLKPPAPAPRIDAPAATVPHPAT